MNSTKFYGKILEEILVERQKRNNNYSLRALARDLEIDPSNLSKIINGKYLVTPKFAYKLASHLKLEGEEKLKFIALSLE